MKKYLLVADRTWQLALSTDGKTLYSLNGLTNGVSVIDTADPRVSRSVGVGRLPWGIVIAP